MESGWNTRSRVGGASNAGIRSTPEGRIIARRRGGAPPHGGGLIPGEGGVAGGANLELGPSVRIASGSRILYRRGQLREQIHLSPQRESSTACPHNRPAVWRQHCYKQTSTAPVPRSGLFLPYFIKNRILESIYADMAEFMYLWGWRSGRSRSGTDLQTQFKANRTRV